MVSALSARQTATTFVTIRLGTGSAGPPEAAAHDRGEPMNDETGYAACSRIYEQWHDCAKARDVAGLLVLYAADATFESPLVPAILDDVPNGVLEGKSAIRRFLDEGTRRRPNDLVRWYRTGTYLTNGRTLAWEYPRATPDGDQIDIVEVMEVASGLIQHHRIYWGWKGSCQIAPALARRAPASS